MGLLFNFWAFWGRTKLNYIVRDFVCPFWTILVLFGPFWSFLATCGVLHLAHLDTIVKGFFHRQTDVYRCLFSLFLPKFGSQQEEEEELAV